MPKDPSSENFVIGVLGAGAMGRGIVQVAAAGGIMVGLFDTNTAAVDDAIKFIGGMFDRAAEKGRMEKDEAAASLARIHPANSMNDFVGCDAVSYTHLTLPTKA